MYKHTPSPRTSVPSQPAPKSEDTSSKKPSEAEKLAEKLADTDGWLTRNEVCDTLRCSPQTVKNYEERGLLKPRNAIRKDRLGSDRSMLVYNPKEIAALPARNPGGEPRVDVRAPGELAARAFELFRENKDLAEVIIELRENPDRIDHLYERWLDYSRGRYVITPQAKTALEGHLGKFEGVADLIEIVGRVMAVLKAIGEHMGSWNTPEELIAITAQRFTPKTDSP